jgi:hypothetical protein
MEPAREQSLNAFLRGGTPQRRDARVPPGAELDVRRQAGIDEALGVGDCLLVKPGNPGRQRVHECVEVGIGQCPVHVAIGLGLVATDVFRTQEHL